MNKDEATLKNLSDRLTYVLEKTGMRKADLARAVNARPQAIQWLCNSVTSSSRYALDIAKVLKINPQWLIKGEGPIFVEEESAPKIPNLGKMVPIISVDYFVAHDGVLAKLYDFEKVEWTVTERQEEGIYCFIMNDISMEPLLPYKSKLFFKYDPSYKPQAQDILIVYLPVQKVILIRQCTSDGSIFFLTPKNSALFKSIPLDADVKVIGIIIDCHIRLIP